MTWRFFASVGVSLLGCADAESARRLPDRSDSGVFADAGVLSTVDAADLRPTVATPGVCAGRDTRCDLPTFVPSEVVASNRLDCVEGSLLEIEWQAELGTFPCLLPGCYAVNPLVTAGGGHWWAVAELEPPNANGPLGSGVVAGFAVFDFDASGSGRKRSIAELRSPTQGNLPYPYTRAVQGDADGTLRWASTNADNAGIELRGYAAGGEPLPSRLAVEQALYGHARWAPDGFAVVTYRYSLPARDGGESGLRPGIAGFDSAGKLLWNQTALERFFDADSTLASIRESVAFVNANHEAFIRTAMIQDGMEGPNGFVKLGADGNVEWARDLSDARSLSLPVLDPATTVLADGSSVVVALGGNFDPATPAPTIVEGLDSQGGAIWRMTLPAAFGVDAVAFDRRGRAVIAADTGVDTGLFVIDGEAKTCTRFATVSPCITRDGGADPTCGSFSLAVVDDARVFFGVANRVGVVSLP